jgi:hypothetical protein
MTRLIAREYFIIVSCRETSNVKLLLITNAMIICMSIEKCSIVCWFSATFEFSLNLKFRVFWDIVPCSHVEVDRRFGGAYCPIIKAMSIRTSETSVHFNVTTRRYIPEDSKTSHLKSHSLNLVFISIIP